MIRFIDSTIERVNGGITSEAGGSCHVMRPSFTSGIAPCDYRESTSKASTTIQAETLDELQVPVTLIWTV